ncbi:MAG: sugar phosphate isomerase/epimerase [Holdemanella sp.]|nr:sugar phosphate isomerase/epimerase [Holdemanella sp.]
MQLSIITDQIHNDLETALKIIQKEGYSYVEIHNVFNKSIEQCNEKEAYRIKELLDAYNMTCTNISSTIFFLCPLYEKDTVSLFNDSFYSIKGNLDIHLEHLVNACRIAKILDCPRIRLFPFRFPDNRKGPYGTDQDLNMIIENMKKAVEIAEEYNITLVIENCPYSHLPKGLMTVKIVEEVNSSHLKLLWDPANSYRAYKENVPDTYLNISLIDELKQIYPYIDHVHIKDYHYDPSFIKPFIHTPIYKGDIDFDILFNFLKSNNYDKALSLEPEVDFQDAIRCLQILKEKVQD